MPSSRKELKKDVIQWLISLGYKDREDPKVVEFWIGVLQIIKDEAYQCHLFNPHMWEDYVQAAKDRGVQSGDEFYPGLTHHFSPRHYNRVAGYVRRYEGVLEAEQSAEEEISQVIETYKHQRSNHLPDPGNPLDSYALVVYDTFIEVRAYQKGASSSLPKDKREWVGGRNDYRWHYPITEKNTIQYCIEKLGGVVVTAKIP